MRVTVRYFAAFRDATGCAVEHLDTAAASVSELFTQCTGRHHRLHHETSSLVAINDEMSDWNASLSEGDEVLFFPPVAGG